MKLSVVSTMYHSAPYVAEFCARIIATAEKITPDFEIVLVNDGSPDDALQKAVALSRADPRIVVVDLSRNFGHHRAILTGLREARGQHIYLTDIDLEEEPELLATFWATMGNNPDCDVVGGIQQARKGRRFDAALGTLAWWIMERLTPLKIQRNLLTSRLMTRRYVDALMTYPEKDVFLAALCADVGFKQIFILAQKKPPENSTYTFTKRLKLFASGVTAFSTAPLIYTLVIAAVLFGISSLVGLYALVMALFGNPLPGWASIVLMVALATAVIMLVQGMTALYVAHIFNEVKNRPLSIIRQIHGRDS